VREEEKKMPKFPWPMWGVCAGIVVGVSLYFGLFGPNWRLPTEEEKVQWSVPPTGDEDED
jgi:hypothetical protein